MSKTVAKLNFCVIYHFKIIYFDITVTSLYDPKKPNGFQIMKPKACLSLFSPFRYVNSIEFCLCDSVEFIKK